MSERERFERAKYVAKLVEEFKVFCMDSVMEGMADDHEDHFNFIEVALEVFRDIKEEQSEDDAWEQARGKRK